MKTLAHVLGETSHVSPLVRKLRRLGLPGQESWMQLAVQRGCTYYRNGAESVIDPGMQEVSNEELAVALLVGENEFNTRAVRIAGQLIGSLDNTERLLKIGSRERVLPRIRYIADRGLEVEPSNGFWQALNRCIHPVSYAKGLLPHRDRFTCEKPCVTRALLRESRELAWLRMSS